MSKKKCLLSVSVCVCFCCCFVFVLLLVLNLRYMNPFSEAINMHGFGYISQVYFEKKLQNTFASIEISYLSRLCLEILLMAIRLPF